MKKFLFIHLLILMVVSTLAAQAVTAPLKLTTPTGQNIEVVVSGVMDSAALRLYCISGSLGGALLSICLFPVPQWQGGARKAVGSAVAGVAFTPWIMHAWHVSLTIDYVLACSGAVALCSWSVLQVLVPLAAGWVTKWIGAKTQT